MKKTIEKATIPAGAFKFVEETKNCFAENDEAGKLNMLAYSGKVIKDHWYWGDLVIDVSGLQFTKDKYPVLYQHNIDQKIGFTSKLKIGEDGGLWVDPDKTTYVDTEISAEFQKLSKQGFPFQASIYANPTTVERVGKDDTAEVNGYKLKGPATIWRKAVFKETSVAVFGADDKTMSEAFSDQTEEMNITYVLSNTSDLGGEKILERGDEQKMDFEKLSKEAPDLIKEIQEKAKAEVTEDLTAKFAEEKKVADDKIADLEAKLSTSEATNGEMTERVLKLEKQEEIRAFNDIKSQAASIWTSKLAESEVPDTLHSKVRVHVSHEKFTIDGKFDTDKFSEAVDNEIKDWVGRGASSVQGFGATIRTDSPDGDAEKLAEAADEEAVEKMLALAGVKTGGE